MIKKIVRKIFNLKDILSSKTRIFLSVIQSNNVKITGNSTIEKNVTIQASNNSRIIIENSYISFGTLIKADSGGTILIKNSFIGRNCIIVAIDKIEIHENCAIAEMVVIRDQDHIHDLSDKLIENQGFNSAPIIINSNVWIAAKVTVLKGITIKKNAVVGAHCLVTKNIEESSVHVGIPNREIKKR
ncbi:MAG: acyltransferase [Bacteroidota bacterium]